MEEVNQAMMKLYPITDMTETSFAFPKDPEPMLRQLLFLLKTLIQKGYTLSVICLDDFVLRDKILFLKKDTHIVPLEDGHYTSVAQGKCFVPDIMKEKSSLTVTYASVGLFAYYLWTRKKRRTLSEGDFGKLKGTKVYYFIKNAMEKNPILLYL